MRILVVNPSSPPVPYGTGLQVHNWGNICSLQLLGHDIYLVMLLRHGDDRDLCIRESSAAIPGLKMCTTLEIPERDYQSLSSLNLPIIIDEFVRPIIKKEKYLVNGAHKVSIKLQNLLHEIEAELVWYEDFWVAVFDKWLQRDVPAVYNSHDHQARLFFQKYLGKHERNGFVLHPQLGKIIRRLIYWNRYRIIKKIEFDTQRRCQVVFTGNVDDATNYRQAGAKAIARRVPIVGPPEDRLAERKGNIDKGLIFRTPLKILHIGALHGSFTSSGLMWFLDKVWPEFLKQLGDISVNLHIIGSGKPSKELATRFDQPSIVFRGYVQDIWNEFIDAFAMVIPGQVSTGIRIRAPVAFSMMIPAIGNKVSFEGMPDIKDGVTAFFAETPKNYANAVRRLLRDKSYYRSVCRSLREIYDNQFSIEAASLDIQKALQLVVGD